MGLITIATQSRNDTQHIDTALSCAGYTIFECHFAKCHGAEQCYAEYINAVSHNYQNDI
jgi:hypothetical protein